MTDTDRLAYTINGAKTATGLGTTKLYEEIAAGKLHAFKAGRRTLISATSLRAYLAGLPRADIRTGQRKAAA
jgi:hypothetical protein